MLYQILDNRTLYVKNNFPKDDRKIQPKTNRIQMV